MANRRREPPSVSSVTQHVLRGTLDTQVQADIAYTVEGHDQVPPGTGLPRPERQGSRPVDAGADRQARPRHRRDVPRPGRRAAAAAPRDPAAGNARQLTAVPASTAPNQPPSSRPARPRTTSPPDTAVPGLGDAPSPGPASHNTLPLPAKDKGELRHVPRYQRHARTPSSPGLAARRHRPARTLRALRPARAVPVPGHRRALPQGLRRDLDHHPRPRRGPPRPADPRLHPRQG